MSNFCPSCNATIKNNNALFCVNCGAVIGGQNFQNQELLQQHSNYLREFINNVNSENNNAKNITAPLAELDDTFQKANGLFNFLNTYSNLVPNDIIISKFVKQTYDFLQRDNDFQIAFVGTVKAGKSTLINAMLKQDFASTSATPETAVLTKFKYGDHNSIKITFYSQEEWNNLWESANKHQEKAGAFLDEFKKLNAGSQISNYVGKEPLILNLDKEALKKYTGSTDAAHYFVKEAEISFREFPINDKNIVFVDTPGLDDAIDYRSQVTRDYIKRANAVLMCIKVDPIHNTELQTIIPTFDNTCGHPEKVFLIGTQYDTRNEPEEDWNALKTDWEKHVVSDNETDKTKFTRELAKTNILPVAAYISLLCDMKMRENVDNVLLTDKQNKHLKNICFKLFDDADVNKHLKDLYNFANINAVHKAIETFAKDAKSYVINDTKKSYQSLVKDIENYFKNSEQGLQETFEAGQGDVQQISEKIMKEQQKLSTLEESKKELQQQMDKFKSQANKVVEELNKEIETIIASL